MLKYFWSAKTPEHAAAIWRRSSVTSRRRLAQGRQVVLAGYSMGADVLPAIVNRLPIAEQQRVRSIVLMAPERATDFEFHLGGWLQHIPKDALPIAPEVEAAAGRSASDLHLRQRRSGTFVVHSNSTRARRR